MFQICESMKWNHLPEAGGLYDQSPDLLDGFLIIFHERSIHEAEEAEKRKREQGKAGRGSGGRRVAGRRR
jgi:uncharacterized protein (DUF952 family)